MQKTLFISDIHLESDRPDIALAFIQLLKDCDRTVDALYILGDLFETWIGDDDDTPFHQSIIQALNTTTKKGVPIFIMHGNRDFFMGKKFLRETGCQLLAEETTLSLYGTPLLLMHGDTLCTRDIQYLKSRKILRNRFLQFLFLRLPLSIRRKIANKMRAASRQYMRTISMDLMDVTPEAVMGVMTKHKVNHLIHGHTHKPATHDLLINQLPAKRIVLSAWHEQGCVLIWPAQGEIKTETIRFNMPE